MQKNLKRCAVINDLSGFGRCSLTVALPILSAMGIQACPLPTAILSNHTGFETYYFEDFTDRIARYAAQWKKLELTFDSIYTGFLGSEAQVSEILAFLEQFHKPETLLFVDPVMADHGALYPTCTPGLRERMKELVRHADIITPNWTEACFLTGTEYPGKIPASDYGRVFAVGETLLALGPKTVVITGVKSEDNVVNFILNAQTGERFFLSRPHISCEYCGTGDVFASTLCGYLTRGMDPREALCKTTDFVTEVIVFSHKHRIPPLEGVAFEPLLKQL